MKKITLIVCALATAVASFAIGQQGPKRMVQNENMSFRVMQEEFNPSAQKAVAALDTLLVPYFAYNTETYQVGKPTIGLTYSYYQQGWVTPYVDTLIFVNEKKMQSSWLVEGAEQANNWFYFQPAGLGEFALPVMKTPKNDTAVFLDYQVAGLTVADWHNSGNQEFYAATAVAPAHFYGITKCGMYTEDPRQEEDGQDWWQVGGGSIGDYSFGSHLTNPWDGGYFDTTMVPFFQAEGQTMFINDITVACYSKSTIFPAEDDHVRLSIFPMDAKGSIDWANPIASAIANAENFTAVSGYTNIGLLEFDFLEEDPITGAFTPTQINVAGNFVVALDQYNDGTTNIGFFCDYYNENGQTYVVGRDSETGEQYITGLWAKKHNILMTLDVIFPTFVAPEKIDFANGETEKSLAIPSNIWDEDMEIEADEWISVDMVTETYEDGDYLEHNLVNKMTVTVEASDEKRDGVITIYALGTEFEVAVSQNGGTQGVESVKAVNDNKTYNVLGVEVGEDYKGIVIRNGEKFIR